MQESLPKHVNLRIWQEEYLRSFFSSIFGIEKKQSPNYLLVATPGAGKTWAQLSTAYILKQRGIIDWIIICVPSDHLRNQMGKDAWKNFGLDLYHSTGFAVEDDHDGEVITYAQVGNNNGIWRKRCADRTVLLCADEVHHLGEEKSWGEQYKQAFSSAKYRLSTSGTPFRTDNQQIPWVQYEQVGDVVLSQADYEYGYGRAVADGVCRHVIFPTFNAECHWQYGFESYKANFDDQINKHLSAQRRNTAIGADNEWIQTVFADANKKLTEIREDGHCNAGGLIICRDKMHAASIAKIVEAQTGAEPELVTSDDNDASDKIEAFADEKGGRASRWIVAVKMVSEGVDIKRLRVAIYASNVTTEMYFRQTLGRVIRIIGGDYEETAYFYTYPDPILLEFIQRVKEEVRHEIKAQIEREEKEKATASEPDRQLKFFVPLEANAEESDHFWDQKRYAIADIKGVQEIARTLGVPEAKCLEILRLGREMGAINGPVDFSDEGVNDVSQLEAPNRGENKTQLKKATRKRISKLAKKLAIITEEEYAHVYNTWNSYAGHRIKQATLSTLEQQEKWVSWCLGKQALISPNEWLKEVKANA